jgi:hypothetical protein
MGEKRAEGYLQNVSSRVTKRAAAGWRWIGDTPLHCERDDPRWSL